jgi:hypothetical protein
MTYHLLRSLYFGRGANADITDDLDRARLHVETPLDEFIPKLLHESRDVVLTGNPGDGKSHLAKALIERNGLGGVEVELDLSANTAGDVVRRWTAATESGAPFLLCANEGPLTALIPDLQEAPALRSRGRELAQQLGHLVGARREEMPAPPEYVTLIDLADRNVVDRRLISRCLARVCHFDYLPDLGHRAAETSAGINLALFIHAPEARERFGSLLEVAGRRLGAHVTFRQLWGTISFALTAGKPEEVLEREVFDDGPGLGTLPLDNLCGGAGKGPLIEAVLRLADPAEVPVPDLDEAIWASGAPRNGEWMSDEVVPRAPAAMWALGQRKEALATFKSLKRYVTLAHTEGERVIKSVEESDPHLPTAQKDEQLREVLVAGIRGLFLSPSQQAQAPEWLKSGVPLWIFHTFQDVPVEERPHVATDSIEAEEFRVLRPLRAPWLVQALGPPPEVAWLWHEASGVSLRVDAAIVRALHLGARSDGPVAIPEPVSRFIARIAGHLEGRPARHLGEDHFAVLQQPRGRLVGSGAVRGLERGGTEYVGG